MNTIPAKSELSQCATEAGERGNLTVVEPLAITAGGELGVIPSISEEPIFMETPANPNQATINGLRKMADFLERNPQFPIDQCCGVHAYFFCWDDIERFRQITNMLGPLKKEANGEDFKATRDFGGSVSVVVKADRKKVCTRIPAGTKTVKKMVRREVTPGEQALLDSLYSMQDIEEDQFEWQCPGAVVLGEPESQVA